MKKKITKKQIHKVVDYSIKKYGKAYKKLAEYDAKPNKPKVEEITRHEKIYFELRGLGKRLGEVVWGSVAFDLEIGKTRHNINKIIDETIATATQRAREDLIEEIEGENRLKEKMDELVFAFNVGKIKRKEFLERMRKIGLSLKKKEGKAKP